MSNDYWNRPTPDGEMNDKRPDQANGPAAEGSWEPNSLANDETRYGPAADGDESQTPYGPAGNTNYNTYGPTDGADFSGNEQPGAGEIPAGEHRGNQPHDPSVINHQQGAQPLNYSQDPTLTRNGTETPYGPVADQVMTPYGPAGNENYDSYGPTDGADYAGYGQPAAERFNVGGDEHPKAETSYGTGVPYGEQAQNYGNQATGSANFGQQSGYPGISQQDPGYQPQQQADPSYGHGQSSEQFGSLGSDAAYGAGTSGSFDQQGSSVGYGDQSAAGYGQQGYGSGSYGDQSATFGGSYGDQGSNSYGSANYGQQAYGSGSYGDPSASAGTSGYGDPSYGGYTAEQSYGSNDPNAYGAAGYQSTGYSNMGSYQDQSQPYGAGYAMQSYGGGMPMYSPWSKRAISALIDYIVPGAAVAMIMALFPSNSGGFVVAVEFLLNLLVLAFIIYNTGYLAGTTGQSYGRKVAGTRLVSANTGQPIGFGMSVLRYIVHFVDAIPCGIGYLWPLWDESRQTFADKIMSTVVVDDNTTAQQNPNPGQGY